MIVEITGRIEISLDDPARFQSVQCAFECAIEEEAINWGSVTANSIDVAVLPEPEDEEN